MTGARRAGTAVVTGGASGIGLAVTTELARRGWSVGVLDLQPSDARDHAVEVDITDAAVGAGAARDVEARPGPGGQGGNVSGL